MCNITISGNSENGNLNDVNFIQKIYDNSIIQSQYSCYVYLKLAYLLALKITPLCDNSTNCYIRRINFIALTDYEKIESFFDFNLTALKQSFCFAFTTALKPNNSASPEGFYYIFDNSQNLKSIENDIFTDKIYYTFDPTKNFYNAFIVTNESSLQKMASYADYILEDAYSSIKDYWGFLSPLFYVVSVKLENGSHYQTVNVFLNGMSSTKFVTSLQTLAYGTLTNNLNTSLAQKYLKQIYNNSNEMIKDQWNVILTDEFPHWLKNTSIIFNSFLQHLDIYLMSFNNSAIANELEKGMEESLNEILVNDKNSTKRGNHVLLIPFNGPNSFFENVKQMPTIKKYMGATIFSYHQPNQWWIWAIVGGSIFLILIALTVIMLLWKYRKWKKIMQKYAWAVDSGM
uniref:Uncharacterized protein n=1 Tax=Panagrolaimus davidi TaxID=227884 RepID=A0A914P018_9BILA